jgi:hypothetical protein
MSEANETNVVNPLPIDASMISQLECYYKDMREFKSFFIKNCWVDKKYEAYKVWAHWLIRNLCEVQDNYHMIPGQSIVGDTDIANHLKEKGADPIRVPEFYSQVVTRCTVLYQKYHQFKADLMTNPVKIEALSHLIAYLPMADKGNIYHMFQLNETYIKHNDLKFQKLVHSYQGDPKQMNFYLFEVGFNYYILDGHSLQWCIPPKVFNVLNQSLGIQTELFAGPMNAILPMYCSLFYADRQFGALDNFFNLDPNQVLEGSFEVNPPFIENIFIKSSAMVVNFLNNSQAQGKDLLFVYVMPDWLDSKGYQMLAKSKYLIEEIIFKENKHFYYQSSNDRMVLANFESHVMIIGTSSSKPRWTQRIKAEVIKHFSYYDRKIMTSNQTISQSQL